MSSVGVALVGSGVTRRFLPESDGAVPVSSTESATGASGAGESGAGESDPGESVSVGAASALVAVVVVAALVQGVAGFGFSLMAMPLLSVILGAKNAVAVASLVGVATSILLVARTHRNIARPVAFRLVGGAVLGMPLGIAVLASVPEEQLRLLIGLTVLAFVVVIARGWRVERGRVGLDLVAGFTSGVLNTSVGTNGPPLVLTLQARGLEPEPFRATMSVVFLASTVVGNALLAWAGRYNADVVTAAGVCLPAMVVGAVVGDRLHRRVAPDRFRTLVLAMLVVSALSALISVFA